MIDQKKYIILLNTERLTQSFKKKTIQKWVGTVVKSETILGTV